jgi:hypothetical protein
MRGRELVMERNAGALAVGESEPVFVSLRRNSSAMEFASDLVALRRAMR